MKKFLKIVIYLIVVIVIVIGALIGYGSFKLNSALSEVRNFPPINLPDSIGNVDTGSRIALIRNGCLHCHGLDFSGKVFIDDPLMGQIAGSNITPARLKDWTDEEIARAIRYGVGRDNKSIRFMPSAEFQYLSKGDLASVIAYLRSIEPVNTPSPELSFGLLARILYGLNQLPVLAASNSFINPDLNVTKPEEASSSEFGKYLVESSCVGCHRMDLSGGTIQGAPPDWPQASPLNNLKSVGYTQDGFKQSLRSGVKPNGEVIRPPMAEATVRIMSDMELEAIWKYLDQVEGL